MKTLGKWDGKCPLNTYHCDLVLSTELDVDHWFIIGSDLMFWVPRIRLQSGVIAGYGE